MNSELEMLSQWYMVNKLSLNTSKTQYVLFSKDGRQTYDNLEIRINGNSITSTNPANFFGLTIDNTLTWEYHIVPERNGYLVAYMLLTQQSNSSLKRI